MKTTRLRYVTIGLAIGSMLLLAGTASAAQRDQVPAMFAVGAAYFGAEQAANCDNVAIHWAEPRSLDGPDAVHADGTPREVWGRGGGCQVWLVGAVFDRVEWQTACQLAVHEYGHAIGLHHTLIPGDIMNGEVWPSAFPPCTTANPYAGWIAHLNRAELRLVRLEQRCERRERLGWSSRKCWRRWDALDGRVAALWRHLSALGAF